MLISFINSEGFELGTIRLALSVNKISSVLLLLSILFVHLVKSLM